jgi:hypothetical protein
MGVDPRWSRGSGTALKSGWPPNRFRFGQPTTFLGFKDGSTVSVVRHSDLMGGGLQPGLSTPTENWLFRRAQNLVGV